MGKFFMKREWKGTFAQLAIFALLLPFLSILLGILKIAVPESLDKLIQGAMSSIPGYDPIQGILIGLNVGDMTSASMSYIEAVMAFVLDNVETMMYLGMWLYAFRVIFKEILRIPGIPLLQVVCGLFMGALTYPMLEEPSLRLMATGFLIVLNAVITIIFVPKSLFRKIVSVALDLALQSLLAALTIAYVAILILSMQGGLPGIGVTISTLFLVLAFWLGYQIVEYIFT